MLDSVDLFRVSKKGPFSIVGLIASLSFVVIMVVYVVLEVTHNQNASPQFSSSIVSTARQPVYVPFLCLPSGRAITAVGCLVLTETYLSSSPCYSSVPTYIASGTIANIPFCGGGETLIVARTIPTSYFSFGTFETQEFGFLGNNLIDQPANMTRPQSNSGLNGLVIIGSVSIIEDNVKDVSIVDFFPGAAKVPFLGTILTTSWCNFTGGLTDCMALHIEIDSTATRTEVNSGKRAVLDLFGPIGGNAGILAGACAVVVWVCLAVCRKKVPEDVKMDSLQ